MLPCFNYLWDLFYIDKVKTIPSNIGDLLTEVGLAFWIMDDGGLGSNGTLNLHTDSYILTEVNLLIDVLKRNFDINSRISIKRPGQWIIVIPKKEVPKVAELTIAHMHPSMLYKINVDKNLIKDESNIIENEDNKKIINYFKWFVFFD